MKVKIQLSDEDVRAAIEDKVMGMLSDEVLGCGDPQVEIEVYAAGYDENDKPVCFDMSDPEDWAMYVDVTVHND
ncbi:MAG: hypothetical protein VST68_00985 [Nitrospirota bacterium]|nr:hypothetical protein [Nitrospirota bacterium]